jgi:hypothetical protein
MAKALDGELLWAPIALAVYGAKMSGRAMPLCVNEPEILLADAFTVPTYEALIEAQENAKFRPSNCTESRVI